MNISQIGLIFLNIHRYVGLCLSPVFCILYILIIDRPIQNEGRISRTVNSRLMPLFAVWPHGEYHYRLINFCII